MEVQVINKLHIIIAVNCWAIIHTPSYVQYILDTIGEEAGDKHGDTHMEP